MMRDARPAGADSESGWGAPRPRTSGERGWGEGAGAKGKIQNANYRMQNATLPFAFCILYFALARPPNPRPLAPVLRGEGGLLVWPTHGLRKSDSGTAKPSVRLSIRRTSRVWAPRRMPTRLDGLRVSRS